MKQDSFKNFISRLAAKLAGKGSRTKHLARKSKDKVEDLETRTLLTSILAVDNANNLLQFDSSNPTTGVGPLVPITGLGVGEVIEGIDVRAANGEVYGLGITDNGATRTGQIYTIDPSSGAALAVGTSFANNLADTDAWGFDADPVNDILRVVNDAEQNLEVSPVTGALISTDTNLAGNPNISGIAYTPYNGVGSTLYGLSHQGISDFLETIGGANGVPSPAGGTVTPIAGPGAGGSLSIHNTDQYNFDIDSAGNAWVTAKEAGSYNFYSMDLSNGVSTFIGTINGPGLTPILGMTSDVGDITLVGTIGDDTLVINATGPNSGTYVFDNQAPVAFNGTQNFSFFGGAGNDKLTINNGPVGNLFAATVTFDGQTDDPLTGGDSLVLTGGGGAAYSETYSIGAAAGSGAIATTGPAGTQTINFAGLEPVTDTVPVGTYTFNASAGADLINVTNGPLVGLVNTMVLGDGAGGYEDATIGNKVSVVINALGGVDAINLNDTTAATLLTTLSVDSGDGNDVVTVLATTAGVTTNITSTTGAGTTDDVDLGALGPTGTVQGIKGVVNITNPPGFSDINVNDVADATARVVTVTNSAITGLAPAAINYSSADLDTLTIDGGSGGNSFTVTSTSGGFPGTTTINGGSGNDAFNIAANGLGGGGVNNMNGQGGNDTFTVTGALTPTATLNVNGGAPAFPSNPGDTLVVENGTTVTPNGVGSGFVAGVVSSYTSIENVTGGPFTLDVATANFGIANNALPDAEKLILVNGGATLDVLINGVLVGEYAYASVGAINVTGSQDADTLTVDNSGGMINRAIGFAADNSGAANGNQLNITGNPGAVVARETYIVNSADQTAGTWILDTNDTYGPGAVGAVASTATATQVVSFSGLSPADTDTPATNFDVILSTNSDNLTVQNGGLLNGAASLQVVDNAGTFETFRFANKTNVRIMGNSGADFFDVNYTTAAAQLASLEIDGHIAAGVAGQAADDNLTDEFNIAATAALTGNGLLSLNGDGGADLFQNIAYTPFFGTFDLSNVNGPIAIDGGTTLPLPDADKDNIVLSELFAAAADTNVILTNNSITNLAPAVITYANVETLFIGMTSFADTIDVLSTQLGTSTIIDGSSGSDTVTVGNQTADFNASVHDGSLAAILGAITILPDDGFGANGTADVVNVDATGDAALAGSASITNVGSVVSTVFGGFTISGPTTTLANFAPASISYIHSDVGGTFGLAGAGQRLEHLNVRGSKGNDIIAVNDTTAVTQTVVDSYLGNDAVTINGTNLSASNLFQGNDGNDTFNLNITGAANSIGSTSFVPVIAVQIEGDNNLAGTAGDSVNRDRLNISDTSGIGRALDYNYLNTQGDINVATNAAFPNSGLFGANIPNGVVTVRSMETLVSTDNGENNDLVRVFGATDTGTIGGANPGTDILTAALLPNNTSALVYRDGTPYQTAPPDDLLASRPGLAGGGISTDLLLHGLGVGFGLTLDGNGTPAGGDDRAIVQALSETNLVDVGNPTDIFGFGAGVLQPGVGLNNAYDTIGVTDSTVTTVNNVVGPLTTVHLNTGSFVQTNPLLTSGLIVNGGDEANFVADGGTGAGIPDAANGFHADNITVTLSSVIPITINGNDPTKQPGNHHGDRLNIAGVFANTDVWSNKLTSAELAGGMVPTVGYSFTPFGGGTLMPLRTTSIEYQAPIATIGLTLVGDNNDPAVDQHDTYVVTGGDVDFNKGLPFADADGANELSLNINGSIDIPFRFVQTLNVSGDDSTKAGDLLSDSLEVTPWAGYTNGGAGQTPLGWGVATNFDQGAIATDGDQTDLLTVDGISGISENTSLVPSAAGAGQVIDQFSTGELIAVINYVNNTGLVFNGNVSNSDTDNLTLYGTDGVTAQTSGNDSVVVNYGAAGTFADPFLVLSDSAVPGPAGELYSVHNIQNFGTVTLSTLAGNDSVTILDNGAGAGGFQNTILNVDLGDGNDVVDASGSTSTRTYSLIGGAGNDTITGGVADDFLDGGAGNDTLNGGAGSDTIRGGDGNDVIIEIANGSNDVDSIDGGAGLNTIQFTGIAGSGFVVSPGADPSHVSVTIGTQSVDLGAISTLNLGLVAGDTVDIGDLSGTELKNISVDTAGQAAAVTVEGRATADNLAITSPVAGTVDVAGLAYNVAIANATIAATLIVNGNEGDDTIKANAGVEGSIGIELDGGAGNDYLSADAVLNGGIGDDTLIGGSGADTIDGGDGNDTIDGGTGGNDSLTGGNGDDTFLFDAGATSTINGGAGFDVLVVNGTAANNFIDLSETAVTVDGQTQNLVINDLDQINVNAGDGNDIVHVFLTATASSIDAGAGNDTVDGSFAGNISTTPLYVTGGDGDDTLTGGSGDDTLVGGAGNDTLSGGDGADLLDGGDGVDVLAGGAGGDTILGGADGDIINIGANDGADYIDAGSGADYVDFTAVGGAVAIGAPATGGFNITTAGATPFIYDVENLEIDGSAAADQIALGDLSGTGLLGVDIELGSGGNDSVSVTGRDTADDISVASSGAGSVTVDGLAYQAVINGVTTADGLTVSGGAGDDTLTAVTGVNAVIGVTLDGGDGNDYLSGDGTLLGDAGDDTLVGGTGNDTLDGGDGNDTLDGGAGGTDSLTGGNGDDTYLFDAGATTTINAGTGLPGDFDVYQINGTAAGDTIVVSNTAATVNGQTQNLVITGVVQVNVAAGAGNDSVNGSAATSNLSITGGDGNDTLTGGSGADVIDGGAGTNVITGGGGADQLSGSGSNTFNWSVGDGLDTIIGSGTDSLVFNGDAGNNAFTLGATGNHFTLNLGAGGVNTVGVSNVQLNAGAGNDSIVIGDLSTTGVTSISTDLGAGLGDAVTVNGQSTADNIAITSPAAGQVSVQGLSYALAISTVAATDSLTVNGNAGDDTIKANAGVEATVGITLDGGAGNDYLSADATLLGGIGDDTLIGGAGNDTIDGGDGNDTIDGGSGGTDSLTGGNGDDTFLFDAGVAGPTTTINGGAGFDTFVINGTAADDVIAVSETGVTVNGHTETLTPAVAGLELFQVNAGDGTNNVTVSLATVAGNIVGGSGVDTINGSASAAPLTISGGAGNDTLTGGSGADSIDGGAGNDVLVGGAGDDTLTGDAGDDSLTGGLGNDTIDGGDGNDSIAIDTTSGTDAIDGGAGNDSLTITGSAGADTFIFGSVVGLPTAFSLTGSATSTTNGVETVALNAGAGDDTVAIGDLSTTDLVALTVDLGAGTDNIGVDGTQQADNLTVTNPAAGTVSVAGLSYGLSVINSATDTLTVNGLGGDDTIKAVAGVEAVIGIVLSGGEGNDYLSADATLNGGNGDDTLVGGSGNDTINGNGGDDTIVFSAGGTDNIDGGAGFDTFLVNGTAANDTITVSETAVTVLGVGTENLVLVAGSMELFQVNAGDGTNNVTVSLATVAGNIVGGSGVDTINGSASAAPLTISGGAGNDTLTGGSGADSIDGGAGNDVLVGGAGDDTLTGDAGDDSLTGGLGNDTVDGGDGNDSIAIDTTSGTDAIDGGDGNDSLTITGSAGADTFIFGSVVGVPTAFSLTGSVTSTTNGVETVALNAGAGDDTVAIGDLSKTDLVALTVDLGAGTDSIGVDGTQQADNLTVTSPSAGTVAVAGLSYGLSVINSATDTLTVNGLGGDDTIKSVAGVEAVIGIVLNGDDGDDYLSADAVINGGAGDDTLVGGSGNDTLNGNAGDDTFVFSDGGTDTIDGGTGFNTFLVNGTAAANTISVSETQVKVDAATENLTLVAGTIQLFDVNAGSGIDTVTVSLATVAGEIDGGAGNDTIDGSGSAAPLTITGGDGNDTLTGGSGADIIDGGIGNDVIVGGAGADTITGGDGNDSITGSAGADAMDGGAGTDTFFWSPGDGADTVVGGDDGADTLVFNGSAAADTFTLGSNGNHFTLTIGAAPTVDTVGVEHIQLNGLAGADTTTIGDLTNTEVTSVNVDMGAGPGDTVSVVGTNIADNIGVTGAGTAVSVTGLSYNLNLAGSTTGDTLTVNGLGGNDVITAAAGTEAVIALVFNGGDGDDTLTGSGTLNGNAGNDTITGLAGNDTLSGGDGNDILNGGDGNDSIDGGNGDDLVYVSNGTDTVVGGAGFDTITYLGTNAPETLSLVGGPVIAVGGLYTGSVDVTSGTVEQINVYGQGGNDAITVGVTTAVGLFLDGGDGNDIINATGSVAATIDGDAGNDNITGTAFADLIDGGLGDDLLFGMAGNDTITGGAGNDTITGGTGADNLSGGDGTDEFDWTVGDGGDTISGGSDGGDLAKFLGTAAADAFLLSAGALTPHLNVTNGLDVIDTVGVEDIVVNTGAGADSVTIGDLTTTEVTAVGLDLGAGPGDAVTVNGRNTADNISVSAPTATSLTVQGLSYTLGIASVALPDTLTVNGNEGDDSIKANVGVENTVAITFNGNDGNDFLSADAVLNGGNGDDTLVGGAGNDTLNGGAGNDFLTGNAGVDAFDGGAGYDTIVETRDSNFTLTDTTLAIGAEGTDTIVAGSVENAILTGGQSANTFFIGSFTGDTTVKGAGGSDTVDFSTATQAIHIDLDAVGADQVINLAGRTIVFADIIENLNATPFNDTINVDIAQFNRLINGESETSIPPGDRLNVDLLGSNASTTKVPNGAKLGSFNGTINGSGFTGTITYKDIETLNIQGANSTPPDFSSATQYTVGNGPRGVVTADVNGDGHLDMIVANSLSNNISVLFGDAFGGFLPAVNYSAGGKHAQQTTTVAVDDLNGDGFGDIVVTNRKTNNVSVLLNDGTGHFGAATLYSTGAKQSGKFPTAVKLGDMNGDGNLDIVTANANVGKNGSVSILLGTGTGSFGAASVTKLNSRRPRDLELADVNGDGNLDVVATDLLSSNVVVLHGNGAGGVSGPVSYNVGVTPNSIIAGDFNGDGITDFVTTSLVSPRLSILLGTGGAGGTDFQTEKEIKYPATKLDISINAADINGDGNLDLLIANRNDNTLSYMLGNGNGTFDDRVDFKTGNTIFREPVSIAVGDFNADGAIDLVVANGGSDDVSVLLHDPIV